MITVGEFASAVRFSTHNSDVGLFLFWFRLVMRCTFWGTSDCSCIADSELFRVFLCLRDVLCFFVGPTEDWYFATNELLLNLILTHCWMSLVLSSGVWFWSWSFVLFGHFYGKNLLFVLASRLILQNCSRDGKCLYYDLMQNILLICFEWTHMSPLRRSDVLSELICHVLEEVVFLKTVFVWMTLR